MEVSKRKMSTSQKAVIIKAALKVATKLATDPEVQKQVLNLYHGAVDLFQMQAGKVNLHTEEEALEIALDRCIRKDDESQTYVAAFVSALYAQHDIRRAAQVGGSLLDRFGISWFPHIKAREKRYALIVDRELEAYFYQQISLGVRT